jgi:hypothetical protein
MNAIRSDLPPTRMAGFQRANSLRFGDDLFNAGISDEVFHVLSQIQSVESETSGNALTNLHHHQAGKKCDA